MKMSKWITMFLAVVTAFAAAGHAAQLGITLDFAGLMPLGEEYIYEGWLIVDGEPVSTGEFIVDDNGIAYPSTFLVDEETAIASETFVLTIEPAVDYDPLPSDTHFLAGDFETDMALLTVGHPAALDSDFSTAVGAYILNTPTTFDIPEDYDQGIWFLDPNPGPGPSLDLPVLPPGWMYEGWVVESGTPITTGKFFNSADTDDDGAGPAAGPDAPPPFPGQDFIDPPLVLPGNVIVVLSVEPDPDDSPDPFSIKPLKDEIVEDVGAGVLQDMENIYSMIPQGTARVHRVLQLSLDMQGLEDLGGAYVYEGWIIVEGDPVSTGRFSVDEDGELSRNMFYIDEEDAASADAFVLSIEPYIDNDPGPSSTKLMAGEFMDDQAELSIEHPAAVGDDFLAATGEYILNTPTTSGTMDDYDQGIWYLDPGAGPGPSLDLPMLPEGWMYEGWIADITGPVTTGKFDDVTGEDSDGAGPTAGPDPAPPFPGQDFIDPPVVVTGYAAVISIEPDPDNSDDPFFIKPLIDSDIEDLGAGILQSMTNNAEDVPAGTAVIGSLPVPHKNFELLMNDTLLTKGDTLYLHYYLHNPGHVAYLADVYILLDVFGEYFAYPSWQNLDMGIDLEEDVAVDPNTSYHKEALSITWPPGAGAASGLWFHGAAFDADTFDFIGELRSIEWGYM